MTFILVQVHMMKQIMTERSKPTVIFKENEEII